MKNINEIKRLQQLAGINEIKINQPGLVDAKTDGIRGKDVQVRKLDLIYKDEYSELYWCEYPKGYLDILFLDKDENDWLTDLDVGIEALEGLTEISPDKLYENALKKYNLKPKKYLEDLNEIKIEKPKIFRFIITYDPTTTNGYELYGDLLINNKKISNYSIYYPSENKIETTIKDIKNVPEIFKKYFTQKFKNFYILDAENVKIENPKNLNIIPILDEPEENDLEEIKINNPNRFHNLKKNLIDILETDKDWIGEDPDYLEEIIEYQEEIEDAKSEIDIRRILNNYHNGDKIQVEDYILAGLGNGSFEPQNENIIPILDEPEENDLEEIKINRPGVWGDLFPPSLIKPGDKLRDYDDNEVTVIKIVPWKDRDSVKTYDNSYFIDEMEDYPELYGLNNNTWLVAGEVEHFGQKTQLLYNYGEDGAYKKKENFQEQFIINRLKNRAGL